METTFISIHNLEDHANILYTSDSIIDILGYTPDEVVNRPAWDFFPFEELPYAQKFHQKRVTMDKAAVLAYCRVRHKDGQWIGCECCFSIVYDVMIVCTSIYKRGLESEKRAMEAPIVRRMFTSSPQDPRYHMLSHLSQKFAQPAKQQLHEPRAALFLNRFTRTLSIMYATTGVADILGISADDMRGRSFYYCIAEHCLPEAIKCLEQAKGNDSVAYLRFWFRDPRQDDQPPPPDDDSDEEMTTDASVDEEDGGIHFRSQSGTSTTSTAELSGDSAMDVDGPGAPRQEESTSRNSSNGSTRTPDTHEAIFGEDRPTHSSVSSIGTSPDRLQSEAIELEAVISCASDGLVVCLRKARPIIPAPTHRPSRPVYENGLFAAPWAPEPVLPTLDARAGAGFAPAFAPSLGPRAARPNAAGSPPRATTAGDQSDFMNAIRDQAVFAWALTGINGSLAEFGQGKPRGESLPPHGLPVWASDRRHIPDHQDGDGGAGSGDGRSGSGDANGWHSGREMFGSSSRSPQDGNPGAHIFGDPGLDRVSDTGMGSGVSTGSNGSTPFNGLR